MSTTLSFFYRNVLRLCIHREYWDDKNISMNLFQIIQYLHLGHRPSAPNKTYKCLMMMEENLKFFLPLNCRSKCLYVCMLGISRRKGELDRSQNMKIITRIRERKPQQQSDWSLETLTFHLSPCCCCCWQNMSIFSSWVTLRDF